MPATEVTIRRPHLWGVLLANGILWLAAILLTGNGHLAALGVVGLTSIRSLLFPRSC